MEYQRIAHSSLDVSKICLGTMTWGEQNTQAQAFAQMDYAIGRGINFIDTAEMYPVPPSADTQGETERIIGHYLKQRGNRDNLVIASKVSAAGPKSDFVRPNMALDWVNIHQAVDASLERLQVDTIDLYQLHWPDRHCNYFGELLYDQLDDEHQTPILETLEALAEVIRQGKVRYIGVSNETPWGLMQYLRLAEKHGLPRIVSVQNPYSLLNRSFEVGMSEISHREELPLLAYSPLAFGALTGKYENNQWPENARLTLFKRFARYNSTAMAIEATQAYVDLAREFGLSPTQMALAFVNSRRFVASNIIGATNLEQLKENIDSLDVSLSAELIGRINELSNLYRLPCP
ncbi:MULTISPECIES: NADP(H)-dependent aldo-keto reductase [unclassified Shewanella]|uniref:NADP(H)-dependent aldo-keto reductase n=1 Tax=unclassified Shewanella TaxID=196818 RepID=UPI000C858E22|nr:MULTISPECIES: NADP(H)-dependent aldo-keto reductase [unclassified Shewanella]MDO6617911.1 NADP(H)-dependent aldo-keto reductase [Shewanella sp. 6_MG-2023]MDO6639964.1 NADP(H)-dependent aldo-keto reductase [Shewanella sp. 5_MG-2023]MDO6678309.1 NADP(H)-dependent aldo-keto reductase [Shewanella sp. 4_MG-2023]MDO6775566.1 NADP(H)-dependent aldo-keto reductase [Shewanella sp. 3_MG-2023]PMG49000.1 aldo/keto reductase [Shewanella sp. 10N.286.52.B9]